MAENLHRAELSPVEWAEHMDEWRRLTVEKTHDASKGPGRPSDGHHETAIKLGASNDTARHAEKIASLPQETRDQAREGAFRGENRGTSARQPVCDARRHLRRDQAAMT